MNKLPAYILLLLILSEGCTFPVEDITPSPDKLIIQSEFGPGENITLYVFKGIGVPADYKKPEVPDSVQVRIWKDGIPLDIQRRVGEIPYFETRALVAQGENFVLSASVPRELVQSVDAVTFVPYEVKAREIRTETTIIDNSAKRFRALIDLEFGFEDNNYEKFYEVEIYLNKYGKKGADDKMSWESLPTPLKWSGDTFLEPQSGVSWLKSRQSLIVDFKKLSLERKISVAFPLETDEDIDAAEINLVLKAHSSAGYHYIYTFDQTQYQYATVNPVLISNIQNGIGCFIACTKTSHTITVDFER